MFWMLHFRHVILFKEKLLLEAAVESSEFECCFKKNIIEDLGKQNKKLVVQFTNLDYYLHV